MLLTSLEGFVWTQKSTICELGLWENVKKHWMKRILSLAFGMLPVLPNCCQHCHCLYDFPICVINWQNISFCFQKVFILPSFEVLCCFCFVLFCFSLYSCFHTWRSKWNNELKNTVNSSCICSNFWLVPANFMVLNGAVPAASVLKLPFFSKDQE